jgi:hypothetical protein
MALRSGTSRLLVTRKRLQPRRAGLNSLAEGILPIGDFSHIVPGMIEAAITFMQSAENC